MAKLAENIRKLIIQWQTKETFVILCQIWQLMYLIPWFALPDCVTVGRTTYLFVSAIWEPPMMIKT